MKVTSDTTRDVVRHFRTIEIEDGPIVDCGETEYDSYVKGTLIKVNKLKLEWVGDAGPETVLVSGPYVGTHHNVMSEYNKRYRMDALPAWLWEILQ